MNNSEKTFVEGSKDIISDSAEVLNWYRNLYFHEEDTTERGIVAHAINDILPVYTTLLKDKERKKIEDVSEKDIKKVALKGYFTLENWLYKQSDKNIEVKSAMCWGALHTIANMGAIDWDTMKKMYGEFISKAMNLG